MSSSTDEPAAPNGEAIPLRPAFRQPGPRYRRGPNAPPAPGAGSPRPEAEPVEAEEVRPPAEAFAPDPFDPFTDEEPGPEARPALYRPPARGVETLWPGAPSGPVVAGAPLEPGPRRRRLPLWLLLVGLGLGGGLGYGLGNRGTAPSAPGGASAGAIGPDVPEAPALPVSSELSAATLAAVASDLDEAYTNLRARKFAEADASLSAAQERRPSPPGRRRLAGVPVGWPEVEVERARVRFYAGDLKGADQLLDTLLRAPGTGSARTDALLLRALVQGALQAPARADELFAAAVAANPVRVDTLFFWGNALRAEGKPAESIPKFRAALLRNQFETMDGIIRIKLWASQLQVDQEAANASVAIDAALAPPNVPTGYAWMGAAARAVHTGRYPEAAEALRKGRALLEPVIFRVVCSDPLFAEQAWRPELAEFYR